MTEPRETGFRDARSDDPARFLRELRELRSHAGLGQAELAARAHYPCDAIRIAEAGPSLPDLPVLSAYVRGCGGAVAEWEERWRAITGSPASPVLTTRSAGCSEAANAGARVGAASAAPDGHDPERVRAALNRVADGMATAGTSSPPGIAGSFPADTVGCSGAAGNVSLTAPTQGSLGHGSLGQGSLGQGSAVAGSAVPGARKATEPTTTPAAASTPPMRAPYGAAPGTTGQGGGPRRSKPTRTALAVVAVALVLIAAFLAFLA